MKIKKTKKNQKKLSRRQIVMYAIYLVIASLSFYFIVKSYQYISNIPEANNITQEEIYDVTRIGESDIKLVRALKNDAFDSWLYEANDDKVKQLKKTQDTIASVIEGKVKVKDIDRVVAGLKKDVTSISDADMEELYVLYYKKAIPRQYKKADTAFQKMTVEEPKDEYQAIFGLLDLLNKVSGQKGMLSVTNEDKFKQSVSLLDEINRNFIEVDQIKLAVVDFETLEETIPEPETRLGKELDSYVTKANDYLQASIMVSEFERKYDDLQSNLSANKLLIKKSVEFPDLVGLTVEQAEKEMSKLKLNLTVQGYTNRSYKDGERVPESQRGIETWDGAEEDKIIRQDPSYLEYEFIVKGSTIQVTVENKPIEKEVESSETSESSSTSTSDSSTSSSDSAEETSSTVTSSSDKLN